MTSSIGSGTTSTGYISSAASGTSSISGLVSGMDTATLISNLMQIASQPQSLLKTQLSDVQTKAAAYRDINTAFASLQTAAAQLTGTNLQSLRTATTSNSSVTATADGTASVGNSVSFTVDQLAQAQTSITTTGWSSPTPTSPATPAVRQDRSPSWTARATRSGPSRCPPAARSVMPRPPSTPAATA